MHIRCYNNWYTIHVLIWLAFNSGGSFWPWIETLSSAVKLCGRMQNNNYTAIRHIVELCAHKKQHTSIVLPTRDSYWVTASISAHICRYMRYVPLWTIYMHVLRNCLVQYACRWEQHIHLQIMRKKNCIKL